MHGQRGLLHQGCRHRVRYKSLKDVQFAADWCKYLCVQDPTGFEGYYSVLLKNIFISKYGFQIN